MVNMSRKLREVLLRVDDPISRDLLTTTNTERGDFLSIRSGFLTYLPTKKIADLQKEEKFRPYASKSRVRGKPAKVAKSFVAGEYSDAAYEQFHNSVTGNAFDISQLRIVSGPAIIDVYNSQYDKRQQSRMMANSCMRGRPAENFGLYTDNPHVIRLITLWDRFQGVDICIARALLWKTDQGIYMDRIYGSEPAVKFLEGYADAHKWGRRPMYGSQPRPDHVRRTMNVPKKGMKIDSNYLPYLDTFNAYASNVAITGEGYFLR